VQTDVWSDSQECWTGRIALLLLMMGCDRAT
jgi:hypothetical protein